MRKISFTHSKDSYEIAPGYRKKNVALFMPYIHISVCGKNLTSDSVKCKI